MVGDCEEGLPEEERFYTLIYVKLDADLDAFERTENKGFGQERLREGTEVKGFLFTVFLDSNLWAFTSGDTMNRDS